jgi:hypothetical protein
VVEGLTGTSTRIKGEGKALANVIKKLAPRWFVVRDAHADGGLVLLSPRHAMSWMRGPMTRGELALAREGR